MNLPYFPSPEQSELERPIEWPSAMPAPGVYLDVPFDEYRNWGGISQSTLKIGMGITWGHAKAVLDGTWERPPTDSLRLGSAIHCWLLEPERFSKDYKISEPCHAVIKTGERKGERCGARADLSDGSAWFCGVHAKGREAQRVLELVSEGELNQIREMERMIESHPAARLMRHEGGQEVSFCLELEGVPFRGRADRLCPATESTPPVIVDLKKIQPGRGTPDLLTRQIREYGYDIQAACYVESIERLTGYRPAFCWLFVEDASPYMIAPVQASDAMIAIGWRKAQRGLASVRDCLSSGYWPGYCEELMELRPEQWELKQHGLTQYVEV